MTERHVPHVALLEASRALADICVCGHHRQQHATRGDQGTTCWPVATVGESCDCTSFQAITDYVTVVSVGKADPTGPVMSVEIMRLVDGVLGNRALQAAIGQVSADMTEFLVEPVAEMLPQLVPHGFDATRDHLEVVIAVVVGWMLGMGIPHQEAAARSACLRERLAIVARAALPSAGISAAVERRSLH